MLNESVRALKLIQDMNQVNSKVEESDNQVVVSKMDSIPSGSNPFHYDTYHMGTDINGINVMYASDRSYMILVFPNGERREIKFDEALFVTE